MKRAVDCAYVSRQVGGVVSEKEAAVACRAELARHVRELIADERKRLDLLAAALKAAGRSKLPDHPAEILEFAKLHVRPLLDSEVGHTHVAAHLAELEAFVEQLEPRSCNPEAELAQRRAPDTTAPTLKPPPRPRLTESVATFVRTASTKLRAVLASTPRVTAARAGRPGVVLVHRDGVIRAGMARALVSARFDVNALESSSQVLPTVRAAPTAAAVIMNASELVPMLPELLAVVPSVAIVAWSTRPAATVEMQLTEAGVGTYVIVPREASSIEVVDATAKLLAPRRR